MTVQEWLGADNKLGIETWEKKYRYNNESFDEWLDRVSGGNPSVKQLIIEKKFLFGGRILANRGLTNKGKKVTYSNCYVTGVDDSIESIYDTCCKLARTFSYGGGVGLDISNLSPRGAKINNAAKETTGAVSFMDTFSQVTNTIGQNGRRGALMLSISCDHPDIEEFIHIKDDLDRVNYANISVRISDEFMKAVENDSEWTMSFTRKETGETIERKASAKALFNSICKGSWDTAEPAMLFWDVIKGWNLLSNTPNFEYGGVNPCAEEPLPVGGSCLLGSINLAEFVKDGELDLSLLSDSVITSVFALNEVLDEGLELHPLDEQRKSVADWRQIGLGVMGIADMLIKLGMRYGSDKSIEFCKHVSNFIINKALFASSFIAKEKGCYKHYKYEDVSTSGFYKYNVWDETDEEIKRNGLRNSQLLTIAPTGTLSTMIGVSGGIEPIFANKYTRKTESLFGKEVYYDVYTPIVKEYMDAHNMKDDSELPNYFVTSQQIPYIERIEMQAAWQGSIDASISSTVNLPNEATVEDIENLYLEAWKHDLKGITVYRDGCRRGGVLTTDKSKNNNENNNDNDSYTDNKSTSATSNLPRGYVIETSDNWVGMKRKVITGCGSLHISAFFDKENGDLRECYLCKGSSGGCLSNLTSISRLISMSARGGIDIRDIVDQLKSAPPCVSYVSRTIKKGDTSNGMSCPSAIANALMDMYNEYQDYIACDYEEPDNEPVATDTKESVEVQPIKNHKQAKNSFNTCPDCGASLVHEGGCVTCHNCGYSKCG